MKLSELKQKHPIAYEVFCEEIMNQKNEGYLAEMIECDESIGKCCNWKKTTQGHSVWLNIHFYSSFYLFDEWQKNKQ